MGIAQGLAHMAKHHLPSREPASPRTLTRAPTAYDVARVAGVSQSAVSRAFTEGASISPATKVKVVEAARQLGYRPNNIARSLATQETRTIGVAISYLENQFYPMLLQELSRAFGALGYRILLFNTGPKGESDPLIEEVMGYRVDALLLASAVLSSHLAEECQAVGIPVVLLNRTVDAANVSSVTGDNLAGGRAVADYLMAQGHERFAYVAGNEVSSTSRDREAGYAEALTMRGLSYVRAVGDYSFEGAKLATRTLLSSATIPDAIFFANDHMAIAGIEVARYEYGMNVGQDVSIVGFDDVTCASWKAYDLTTYSQRVDRMVSVVTETVMAILAKGSHTPVNAVVEGQLIVRSSTRREAT